MLHIETLPSKAAAGKLLVPLAKKLLASKAPDNQLLTSITFSDKLLLADREIIIQTAFNCFANAKEVDQAAYGNWLALCGKEHAEVFKSSITPLIDTLEPEKINELESLTELTLKVLQEFIHANKKHDVGEMMEIDSTGPQDVNPITLGRWSSLPEELSYPSLFASSAEHLLILDLFVDALKIGNTDDLDKLLSSPLLLKSSITLPSLFARVWMTVSYSASVRSKALNRLAQYLRGMGSNLDFQGFIPHIIAGLSDYSKDIREAAANLLTAIHEIYSSNTKHSVIGLMEMYPEDAATTSTLKWLSLPEAKWFVGRIIPKLAECKLDCNYIVRLLGGILDGAGKKGKKEQYDSFIFFLI